MLPDSWSKLGRTKGTCSANVGQLFSSFRTASELAGIAKGNLGRGATQGAAISAQIGRSKGAVITTSDRPRIAPSSQKSGRCKQNIRELPSRPHGHSTACRALPQPATAPVAPRLAPGSEDGAPRWGWTAVGMTEEVGRRACIWASMLKGTQIPHHEKHPTLTNARVGRCYRIDHWEKFGTIIETPGADRLPRSVRGEARHSGIMRIPSSSAGSWWQGGEGGGGANAV